MAFFSSCGEKKAKDGRTDTPTSGTIEFYADESLSPIIDEERTQFEFEFPKAKLKPIYSDEVTGLQMIKDFKTTLLFTTRHLKDSEIAYLKSKSNVIPSVFPIGYDGLAFIVNKNNQDTCITVNDIKRVLTLFLVLKEGTSKSSSTTLARLLPTGLLTQYCMAKRWVPKSWQPKQASR